MTACGASTTTTSPLATSSAQTTNLPGNGRPTVTIGDKNYTEQFVLGELYYEALKAQGFSVQLNRNIGPSEVTLQALQSGRLGMYPEYIDTWNQTIAGDQRSFKTLSGARTTAGQGYAFAHGLQLLSPTPFSDTDAIGVGLDYAVQNGLSTIRDLRKVAQSLTFGAPPQFQQDAERAARRSSRRTGSCRRRSRRSRSAASTRRSTRAPSRRPTSTRPTGSSRPATTSCSRTR